MLSQAYPKTQRLSAIPDSLPPHNIDAEEAILGGILLDPGAMSRIVDILDPEAFFISTHKTIYKFCLKLYKQGESTDFITVSNKLSDSKKLESIGGIGKLAQLLDKIISAVNIDRYALLLMDKFARRQLINFGHRAVDLGYDQVQELDRIFEQFRTITKHIETYSFLTTPKEDKEHQQFMKLVERVKEIEQKTVDPGFKYYKLLNLAKETSTSIPQLQGMYLKSLVANHVEESIQFEALKKTYGSVVQEWFLHGFGPRGSVVLLHALGGTGKTRLIYDWIYHMVCGKAWHGHQVTAPQRRVLIVQTDESQADLINTMEEMGITDEMPIRFMTRWTADHVAALRQEIEKWKPEVILIDSLTSINRNSLYSENDTEYARPVLELRDLAQEFQCLIYLIHHSNGEGGSRGTKAITASVSHVLNLSRPSQGSDPRTLKRILCVEKSRSRAPEKYDLEFNPETGGWLCHGTVDRQEDQYMDIKDRIIELLASNRNVPYEVAEIHEAIGGSCDRVRLACFQLAKAGEINRRRRHKQGGGYLYWLSWEGDRPPNAITFNDHLPINFSNADETSVSEEGVFEAKIGDHLPINFSSPDAASVSEEGVFEAAKISEKNFKKVFEKNATPENTFSPMPYPEQATEVDREGDRKVIAPQEADHLPRLAKVRYIGTDPDLIKICSQKPYLEVLGVDDEAMVTCTAPHWRITHRIPYEHLAQIDSEVNNG